jgi:hypothetical protein
VTHRHTHASLPSPGERAHLRAERRRWRRHKLALVLAAVPLLIGGVVTAAMAAPPAHGPVGPVDPGGPVLGATFGATASAAGPGASPTASAGPPTAAADPDCTLTVPAAPLTAAGLATPYQLSASDPGRGPCHEADPAQTAFVQATVYDPATGALSVYAPLVVDAGRRPALAPVVPALPAGAVVGIWFGFNGGNLTLRSAGGALSGAHCVDGADGSVFGQYAYCDAPAFFAAVDRGIAAHKVTVPALGTARDGRPCPSTRDFALVDQDQSDNVQTQYLAAPAGATAQDTPAARARLRGAAVLSNPSDNALLVSFVDPALGCTPWTVRDLAAGGTSPSMALDEIQANADQGATAALVPLDDPMTLLGGVWSTTKTNLYRAGVDQPALPAGQTPKVYCRDLSAIQAARLQLDAHRFAAAPSPDPAAATNLLAFLGDRLHTSFTELGCGAFGPGNPVSSEKIDSAGAVTAVVFARPTT